MPIPDFQTLLLPTLKLGATGEIQEKAGVIALAEEFNLSEEERENILPSGTMTTIRNRMIWRKDV